MPLLVLAAVCGFPGTIAAQNTLVSAKDNTHSVRASIGPFELSNADSSSTIRLQFAGQLRTVFESRDREPGKTRSEKSLMEARRIRLILSGTVSQPTLFYRLHLSAAPRSLELMDFYFNYKINDDFHLRYGQYKVPFTRYRIQSFQRLTLTDWALVTRYFGAERQMGLAVHNDYERPPEFSYALGLFTGVNARASHAVGLAEFYGVPTANPSDLAHPGPKSEFHPEFFLHLAHNAKGIRVRSDSDEDRGGLRYSTAISAAWDLDPVDYLDLAGRVAPELLVKYRGASASAIGYAGFSRVGEPAGTKLALLAALVQAAYRFSRSYEVSARYALVDFRQALLDDVRRVNERPAGEQVHCAQEVTAGFNLYIFQHTMKWQNDTVWLRQSFAGETRDDFVARSQFQLTF